MAEVDALQQQLHQLELAMATLTGEVRALRELKAQDHEHIRTQISEVDHKRRTTDVTMKALHDRLDLYPPPDKVHSTVDQLAALRNRLAGAIAAGMALGIGGGTALGQILAGG